MRVLTVLCTYRLCLCLCFVFVHVQHSSIQVMPAAVYKRNWNALAPIAFNVVGGVFAYLSLPFENVLLVSNVNPIIPQVCSYWVLAFSAITIVSAIFFMLDDTGERSRTASCCCTNVAVLGALVHAILWLRFNYAFAGQVARLGNGFLYSMVSFGGLVLADICWCCLHTKPIVDDDYVSLNAPVAIASR